MSTPTQTRPGQQDMQARGNINVRSYPAPKQLATVTDLTAQEAQAITEAVNPLIADSLALFTKTKNYHWHLSGSHFRDYHLLCDTQADQLLESVDIMAERVRRVGGTTIRSIGHVSQLQTIKDDNEDFVAPGEMVRRLMEDNLHIAKNQRAAIEVCEKHRDSVTANLLQDILDKTEKRKWFLFEILQGVNNAE